MKKLLIAMMALSMLSSVATANHLSPSYGNTNVPIMSNSNPIDLSKRDNMVKSHAALIIASPPYCYDVDATAQDKAHDFIKSYGHQVDRQWTKDVQEQIGQYIAWMGKSVRNYQDVCDYGFLVNMRINNKVK